MPIAYLDPKVDLVFKRIFGEHKHLLKSFLNALLPLPDDALIEEVSYLTGEQIPEVPALERRSIVDVRCRDQKGRQFIVEMQMLWTPSFEKRLQFVAGQAYVQQLRPGMHYEHLHPVYALAILNTVFDHDTDEYYHHYKTINVINPQKVLKGIEYVLVELPKFKVDDQRISREIASADRRKMQALWLRFLREIDEETQAVAEDLQADQWIAEALEVSAKAAFNSNELMTYGSVQDAIRVEQTLLAGKFAEGRAEGMAAGEIKAKLEIAKQLLASGMDRSQVLAITGLSEDDLLSS